MTIKLEIHSMNKGFEEIKELDENGIEFWRARDLMSLLGYLNWRAFDEVIKKAQISSAKSNQITVDHFGQLTKMVKTGSNVVRGVKDWKLDRYACYLIAQNGDSTKHQIALAQTYFAIQTRRQELYHHMSADEKGMQDRNEVKEKNKKLFSTAHLVGVSNFGKFNDAGYKGLYSMSLKEIEDKKNIPKGELLDYAGSEELGANLFRITQTEAKLKRENIKGDSDAQRTHFDVSKKVRQTIKEIGGEMPENLKPEKHIKKLKNKTKNSNK